MYSPGSFLVLNEALVIIDLETVAVAVAGDSATLIPIEPSPGCPKEKIINLLRIALL